MKKDEDDKEEEAINSETPQNRDYSRVQVVHNENARMPCVLRGSRRPALFVYTAATHRRVGKGPFRQFDSGILGHAGLTSRSLISSIIEDDSALSAFACAFFVASQDSTMLVLQNQSLYDARRGEVLA